MSDNFMVSVIGAGLGAGYMIFCLAIAVVALIGMWKMFEKAGKPGWAAIVPFYNFYCLYDIAFGNGWLFLLMFVPCVGVVFSIMCNIKLAKAFGEGVGFGIGLTLLPFIFTLILGFGSAQYYGPNNEA